MGWVVLGSRGAWQLRELEVRCPEFLLEEVWTAGILGRLHQLKPNGVPSSNDVLQTLKMFGGWLVSKNDVSCSKLAILV